MRLIQPPPQRGPSGPDRSARYLQTAYPLLNIQSRYQHHAGASGYDQLSRYLGEALEIRKTWYWLGETLFRPFCLAQARWVKHYEYSRYDCALELDVMSRLKRGPPAVFHFLYAEKGFRLSRHMKGSHLFAGTVHHPVSHHARMFGSMKHFTFLDLMFVLSQDSVKPWQEVVGHDRVYFVPHGVDCEYFCPSDKTPERLIVFSGYHERDHQTLAAVSDRLLADWRDWKLLMISKDPACREIANRYPNAEAVAHLSNEEYLAAMRKAAVMLLPLKASTACNSTLEALACGVPVITSSTGMESYVDESCGRVCEVGDAGAMVGALERFMDSPEALASARQWARERALEMDWPVVARSIAGYLDAAWQR